MGAITQMTIRGALMGQRLDDLSGEVLGDVVHVVHDSNSSGPAENAFVFVERLGGEPCGRYISWINYYDLDYVLERQPGRWRIVEPPELYQHSAQWQPYGWPGALSVPTVGDLPQPPAPDS
jgi:hypothetical protein